MTQDHRVPAPSDPLPTAFGLYRSRRYAQTLSLCKTILKHDPEQFEALYLSGLVAHRMGNQRIAEGFIERACRARPEVTRFNHMVGFLRQAGRESSLSVAEVRFAEYRQFSVIQGFLLSYPKCGRTWLRAMLGRYLQHGRDGDPLELFDITRRDRDLPTILVSHDDRPHVKPFTDIHEDKSMYRDKFVVLLVRDPRDALVSFYHHCTKSRSNEHGIYRVFRGTISNFVRHEIGGLASIVRYYNIWARNRDVPQQFHVVRYENLHADTHGEFARLIGFFDLPDLGREAVDDAVSFGAFDNLHRLEETGELNSARLRGRTGDDPESFKVRRGVVGGFRDYLGGEDIDFIDDYLGKELDDFYADYKIPSRN